MLKWQASKQSLIAHYITELRDKNTPTPRFRQLVGHLTQLLLAEACADLPLKNRRIETPLEVIEDAPSLNSRLCFVSIMRAGNAMLDAALQLMDFAEVGHIGLYRKEVGKPPVEYFCKLPPQIANSHVILLDPMLATASSAIAAIHKLKDAGVSSIKFLCLISAPEGLEQLKKELKIPVQLYTAALDRELNSKGYILPGLGDAGDRIYATPHDS